MKKITFFTAIIIFSLTSFSQKWEPELTEIWEPVPPVVTPGIGSTAPSDAIILFDGTDLSLWEDKEGNPAQWLVEDSVLTIVPGTPGIRTKQHFGDVQLHIEWRTPPEARGEGQDRGNSGIYLQSRYELQVLDSYESPTYPNGQAGSIYKQHAPLVNACLAPGEWQTYEIVFMAPRFNPDSTLYAPGTFTVFHNGILIQNHVALRGTIVFIGLPAYDYHDLKQSLFLQDHDHPVSYRNIWIREL